MNIEKDIFERSIIDTDKLLEYGFIKEEDILVYKKEILDDSFLVVIEYSDFIIGKIIDLEFGEEYLNYRSSNTTNTYVLKVKDEFIKILIDIRDKCCITNNYVSKQANRLNNYIKDKYKIDSEFLWESTPHVGVYRNSKKKWFGIIMNISYKKVDKKSNDESVVEIVNIKIMPDELEDLLKINGIYEAYHMNKKNWISILLNDSLDDELLFKLLDNSYRYVENL